ncbi:MAG: nitrogen regulation protein NR(II) [Halothiobacillaceae bacterium]
MNQTPDCALLARLFEHQTVALLWLDAGLQVVHLNPSAENLLGLSLRQARGLPVRSILPGEASLPGVLRQSFESGHPCTFREMPLHAAGRDVMVDCAISPLIDPDLGEGVLVEMMDVERHLRIAREEQLLAQQQAARSLLRGLAHEIKNPLGGLRGAAQLLHGELEQMELREYTAVIMREADRLRALVDRMIGPHVLPKKRMLNLHEPLEHVRRLVSMEMQDGRVRLITDYDPSIPELYADPDLLIQAVLNIVRNAMQALAGQADARIVIRTRVLRQFTLGHTRHRLVARIDIEDNGPGIPPSLLDTLFLPMVSGRPGGTGLGLAISQSLIAQHGGLIEFASHPGRTLFSILLPIASPTPETAP